LSRHAALLLMLAVALTLASVFAAYLRPEFMFTLASQLWACF
jgi:hypothetical protein